MPFTEGEHCLPYPTRRAGFVAIGAAATSLIFPVRAQQQPSRSNLPSTPNLEIDPYYPIQKPIVQNADLTRVKGRKGRAEGRTILLAARVLGSDGTPVRNATIEIWQADTNGRYGHPAEPEGPAVDRSFPSFSRRKTEANGRFSFLTVKPGAYQAQGILSGNKPYMRAPAHSLRYYRKVRTAHHTHVFS